MKNVFIITFAETIKEETVNVKFDLVRVNGSQGLINTLDVVAKLCLFYGHIKGSILI